MVAGFHRSGTSMVAQLLNRAGVFLGDDLIGANASNPYGHFEDRELVDIHKAMMDDVGESWHVEAPFAPVISKRRWRQMSGYVERRRVAHRLWGFKDPRVCFYLGAWKHLMPDMKVVAVFRDPAECVHSLKRRHSRDLFRERGPLHLHKTLWTMPDHALRMWIAHNEAMLDYVAEHRDDSLVFPFHAVRHGLPLIDALENAWNVGLMPVRTFEVFDPDVTSVPESRQPVFDRDVVGEAEGLWDRLELFARDDQDRMKELI